MAINRARKSLYEQNQLIKSGGPCIFISHKSEDEPWAVEVGKIINSVYNIDIYLDIYDGGLQSATLRSDDKEIVSHIQKALNSSTHLMCLISNSENNSWWVPYEVGYAKKSDKEISSLKYKDISDVPSFLKVEDVLMGSLELNNYLIKVAGYQAYKERYKNLIYNYQSTLNKYMEWR